MSLVWRVVASLEQNPAAAGFSVESFDIPGLALSPRQRLESFLGSLFTTLFVFAKAPVAIISCVKPSTLWWIGIDFIITAVRLLMAFTIRGEGWVTAK